MRTPGRRVPRSPLVMISPAIDDGLPLAQRRDRLQAAAIFVAQREAEEQIFDGIQPGAREVGGLAGADALQELQRRLQEVGGGASIGSRYCTTSARPIVVLNLADVRRQAERRLEVHALPAGSALRVVG